MKKFYFALNSNSRKESKGLSFTFEPIDFHCGTWRGVYAATDPKEIEALDELVKRKVGVTSINEDEYNVQLKKKVRSSMNSVVLPEVQASERTAVLSGNGGVVVAEGPGDLPTDPNATKPAATKEQLLSVGKVEKPEESGSTKK